MTFPHALSRRGRFLFRGPVLLVVAVTWAALSGSGCSIESQGFGGLDAGIGGSGTGGSAPGGQTGGGGQTASGGVPGSGGEGIGGQLGSGGGAGGTGGAGGEAGTGGGPGGKGGKAGKGGAAGGGRGDGEGGAGGLPDGQGGANGAGGTGGKGGETCDQLVDDYDKALPDARACAPDAPGQCQQLVPTSLSSCTICQQYVNDATRLKAIRARWTAQGCGATRTVCPAIACVAPRATMCVPVKSGASSGTCSQTPGSITN